MRATTGRKRNAALCRLAEESPIPFRTVGHCMNPVIGHGNCIQVSRKKFYLPGDIVAFFSDRHGHVAHRVIGYRFTPEGFCLVTKSDRSDAWDPPVALERVVGRIIAGDCPAVAFNIPIRQRVRSAGDFLRLISAGLNRRLVSHLLALTSRPRRQDPSAK